MKNEEEKEDNNKRGGDDDNDDREETGMQEGEEMKKEEEEEETKENIFDSKEETKVNEGKIKTEDKETENDSKKEEDQNNKDEVLKDKEEEETGFDELEGRNEKDDEKTLVRGGEGSNSKKIKGSSEEGESLNETKEPEEEEEEEENLEEIYLPGLTNQTLFYDLPSNVGCSSLVSKYLSEDQKGSINSKRVKTFNLLIDKSNHKSSSLSDSINKLTEIHSWKVLAEFVKYQIVQTDPTDTKLILKLWSDRFEYLFRLKLFELMSKESKNFFSTINQNFNLESLIYKTVVIEEEDQLREEELRKINNNNSKSYDEDYLRMKVRGMTKRKRKIKIFRDIIPFSILVLRVRLIRALNPIKQLSNLKSIDGLNELLEFSEQTLRYYCSFKSSKSLEKRKLWNSRVQEITIQLSSIFSTPSSILEISHHQQQYQQQQQQQNTNERSKKEIDRRKFIPDPILAESLIKSLSSNEKRDKTNEEKFESVEEFIRSEQIKIWTQFGDLKKLDRALSISTLLSSEDDEDEQRSFEESFKSLDGFSERSRALMVLLKFIISGDYNRVISISKSFLLMKSKNLRKEREDGGGGDYKKIGSSYDDDDDDDDDDDFYIIVLNNLAIGLLYVGNLNQAYQVMKVLINRITRSKLKESLRNDDPKKNSKRVNDSRLKDLNLIDSIVFNFTTLLELRLGNNESIERFKVSLILKLLKLYEIDKSSLGGFNDGDGNNIHDDENFYFDLDGFQLDDVSPHSFKLNF